MPAPWTVIASHDADEGVLELHQQGDAFLIWFDGRVLMNSFSRSSEEALATHALTSITTPAPRVMIGGLGMGYTLRAALDVLPADATVQVVELNPVIVEWCMGPLAAATGNAVADPRVTIELGDVAAAIAEAPAGQLDAILLDLYEGPNSANQGVTDPFYSKAALARTHAALAPGGVLGVWAEEADDEFAQRMTTGFDVAQAAIGSHHVVYLGTRR
ncbi:MAG: hypothetical protein WKG01_10230 [Kofleriaceae bacterium]